MKTIVRILYFLRTLVNTNTYFDDGIGIRHHSDEQVQHNGDVNNRVGSEHNQCPESRVRFHARQVECFEIHFAETRPEQRLYGLEYAENDRILRFSENFAPRSFVRLVVELA